MDYAGPDSEQMIEGGIQFSGSVSLIETDRNYPGSTGKKVFSLGDTEIKFQGWKEGSRFGGDEVTEGSGEKWEEKWIKTGSRITGSTKQRLYTKL